MDFEFYRTSGLNRLKEERLKIEQKKWDSEERKKKALNKIVQTELTYTFCQIFLDHFKNNDTTYISVKDLSETFTKVNLARIRYTIKRCRELLLEHHGMMLANHPGKGYRLGVIDDISIEACKSMFRALSSLINGRKIINHTMASQKEMDELSKELLKICANYGQISLEPLTGLKERVKNHPLYGDIYEQLKELERVKLSTLGDDPDL